VGKAGEAAPHVKGRGEVTSAGEESPRKVGWRAQVCVHARFAQRVTLSAAHEAGACRERWEAARWHEGKCPAQQRPP